MKYDKVACPSCVSPLFTHPRWPDYTGTRRQWSRRTAMFMFSDVTGSLASTLAPTTLKDPWRNDVAPWLNTLLSSTHFITSSTGTRRTGKQLNINIYVGLFCRIVRVRSAISDDSMGDVGIMILLPMVNLRECPSHVVPSEPVMLSRI